MRTIVRLVFAASALLVAACAAPAASPGASGQPAGSSARPAPTPAPKSAYDDPAWAPLIAAARQEGTLVLASGPDPNTRVKLPAAFKERFGVEIEYLAGRRVLSKRLSRVIGWERSFTSTSRSPLDATAEPLGLMRPTGPSAGDAIRAASEDAHLLA